MPKKHQYHIPGQNKKQMKKLRMQPIPLMGKIPESVKEQCTPRKTKLKYFA